MANQIQALERKSPTFLLGYIFFEKRMYNFMYSSQNVQTNV